MNDTLRLCSSKNLNVLKKYSLILPLIALAGCDGVATIDEPGDSGSTEMSANASAAAIDLIPFGCEGSADPSTINASWMAGNWGVSLRIAGGNESFADSEVAGFDVQAAVDVISDIPGVGWVQINLTNGAFGDRAIAPVPALEDINPLAAPQRDLFGELASALQTEGIRVVAYIASQGPAMLKHGAEKAIDLDLTITGLSADGKSVACSIEAPSVEDDQYSTYCSASMNLWRDRMYVLYPDARETLYQKYERAIAEHIVQDFSIRYGSLIDGWWFDHTTAGDAELLGKAALAGNNDATLALNEGEKVPLTNTLPGLANYTFGHPNPVRGTVPQDDDNEPMISSIESATDGILYGPNCEPSLGHIFMPMQETWHTSPSVVFSESKAIEWHNRVIDAGGAITWAIAHQGTSGDSSDPRVLSEPQVKILKRLQVNTEVAKHYPLDYLSDPGITANGVSFVYNAARNGNSAKFNDDTDVITLDDYYGIEGITPRTISGWFRTTDDNGTLVKWGVANPNEQWWLKIVNGKLKLLLQDASVVGSTTVNDNHWHHFAVVAPTAANALVRMYIDGERETEVALGTRFNTQAGREVEVGGSYIGLIDDLRFYERSIKRPEVEYLASYESSLDLELALNLKFDEASWRDGVVDSSAYGRQVTYSSKSIVGNIDPIRGTVAVFDQTAADKIIVNETGEDISTSGFGYNGVPGEEPRSVSAWIKTVDSDGMIVQWGSTAENDGENWIVRTFSGKLRLSIKGASIDGSSSIDDGSWHHIAVVAPDNDLLNTTLYIDGIEDPVTVNGSATTFDTTTVNAESIDVVIGGSYTGSIDELSIYQRALTVDEVEGLAGGL